MYTEFSSLTVIFLYTKLSRAWGASKECIWLHKETEQLYTCYGRSYLSLKDSPNHCWMKKTNYLGYSGVSQHSHFISFSRALLLPYIFMTLFSSVFKRFISIIIADACNRHVVFFSFCCLLVVGLSQLAKNSSLHTLCGVHTATSCAVWAVCHIAWLCFS